MNKVNVPILPRTYQMAYIYFHLTKRLQQQ